MQCKKCGAKLAEGTEICPKCGAIADTGEMPVGNEDDYFNEDANASSEYPPTVDMSEQAPAPSAAKPEQKADSNAPDMENIKEQNEQNRQNQKAKTESDKKSQLEEIADRRNAKKRRQKRNHIITISILVVLLIASGGTAVYLTREGFEQNTPVAIITPEPTAVPYEITLDNPFEMGEETATDIPTDIPAEGETEENTDTTSDGTVTADGTENSPDGSSASAGTSSGSAGTGSSAGTSSSGSGSSGSTSSGTSGSGTSSKTSSSSGTSKTSSSGSGSSGSSSSVTSSTGSASSGSTSTGSSSSSGTASSSSSSDYVPAAVVSSGYENTTAKLIYGKRVDYMQSGGNPIFVFALGNSTCYAYVSVGSSTADVENKYFLATMIPTDAVYFGEPVYQIVHMTDLHADGYLIPESSIRLIDESDIAGFSNEQISYARNEIFARHGRVFSEYKYSSFFEGKSWYSENPYYNYEDEHSNLSSIEKANVAFLLSKETA